MKKEIAIPLAYFITFTCYGTWLHGGKITSVDKWNNIPGTEFILIDPKREIYEKKCLKEAPYFLDHAQRKVVLDTIIEVCIFRAWVLLGAHVRTNHVHLIVHAMDSPEKIMETIKAYASRRLRELKLDDNRVKRWTRHGSTRYLWSDEEVEATIQYVVHEQGEPMALFENKNRGSFFGIEMNV